jgi:hypothetical protein
MELRPPLAVSASVERESLRAYRGSQPCMLWSAHGLSGLTPGWRPGQAPGLSYRGSVGSGARDFAIWDSVSTRTS